MGTEGNERAQSVGITREGDEAQNGLLVTKNPLYGGYMLFPTVVLEETDRCAVDRERPYSKCLDKAPIGSEFDPVQ